MSTTLGVLADTHIPDRAKKLPQSVLDLFADRNVDAILHAGDLSTYRLIEKLEEIAPVYAIRGNADLLLVGRLPWMRRLTFEGVTIGMAHGHGGWLKYIPNKFDYILNGPRKFSYYEETAKNQLPDTKVVVFGHNHVPSNYWWDGQLIFNPGSPTKPNIVVPGLPPSVGFLHIENRNVSGQIVFI
ncbi:MAG TPA: YfcE family phosphodiesterase [Anaerolineales bacterium]|nr:YfcE family phosphodiesterase [Anaerolineales bacterium]